MWRNGLTAIVSHGKYQQQRKLSTGLACSNKSSLNRQGKIMSKLFGEKLKGSKKRWYPTTEASAQTNSNSGGLIFKAAQLSKPGGAGKNTTRRSAVLNKLFMEEISSLLATGGIAESLLGRGLQLTRVKIAPDFTYVNVYWLGQGDPQTDGKLAEDLQRCSGLLRHELSQLRVMGEVPRIKFVQDKTFANIEHVETLLKNLELDNGFAEENRIDFQNLGENRVKHEFYGNRDNNVEGGANGEELALPPMRHDVFGLDHQNITMKILTKMRKTKQAWEAHSERPISEEKIPNKDDSLLRSVQQKIMDTNEASAEAFDKFLAQRRDRKNTPERKKYKPSDEIVYLNNNEDFETEAVISKELRNYLNQEDFLYEDNNDDKKS